MNTITMESNSNPAAVSKGLKGETLDTAKGEPNASRAGGVGDGGRWREGSWPRGNCEAVDSFTTVIGLSETRG
jgi:hypothetical protein